MQFSRDHELIINFYSVNTTKNKSRIIQGFSDTYCLNGEIN